MGFGYAGSVRDLYSNSGDCGTLEAIRDVFSRGERG